MSQNLYPRATEYRVKSGSRATLELTIQDSAGTAKRPVDVNSSIQDATGTSLKAIQNVVAN